MSRKAKSQQVGVALFPFLAVLICTMGALIVLLVLLVQQARVDATVIAAAKIGGQQSGEATRQARERLEDAAWKRELLEKSRAEKTNELAETRSRVAHLEEHTQRLAAQAKELLERAKSIDEGKKLRDDELAGARAEAAKLKSEIDKKKDELEQAKKKTQAGPESYALIPYDGRAGTRRRPIYVECTEFGVIIQPECMLLKVDDFNGPLGPGNPLDSALRAIRDHWERTAGKNAAQPYPLLVVRPSGVVAFGAAKAAISAWDDEWGYELISDEKVLDFGQPDPALSATLNKTVAVARQRQSAMIAMMPRRYQGEEPLRSFTPDPSAGMGSSRSIGAGSSGTGGGLGGNATGRSTAGAPGGASGTGGYGMTGSGAAGYSGSGGLGSNGTSGSGIPSVTSGMNTGAGSGSALGSNGGAAGGYGTGTGGQSTVGAFPGSPPGGSAGSGGAGPGGTGYGGTSSGTGYGGTGGQQAYSGGTSGQYGGPANGTAPGGTATGGGYSPGGAGGSSAGGGSTAGSSSGGSAGGSSTASSGQPGGSSMGGSSSMSAGSPGGPGMPSLNFGEQKSAPSGTTASKSGSSGSRSSAKKGSNWALPQAKPNHIGVTRPIRVSVQPDRVVMLPERGDNRAPQVVQVAPELTPDDVTHVVTTVQNEVKGWGLAVADGYWKPVLQVEVAPGAERQFMNLETALQGSGIDVIRR
jgi:hypothetical protein